MLLREEQGEAVSISEIGPAGAIVVGGRCLCTAMQDNDKRRVCRKSVRNIDACPLLSRIASERRQICKPVAVIHPAGMRASKFVRAETPPDGVRNISHLDVLSKLTVGLAAIASNAAPGETLLQCTINRIWRNSLRAIGTTAS
jgi:hypothetical protein